MPVNPEKWKTYLQDKNAFFSELIDPMVGWLDPYAAKRTIDLLEFQEATGVSGSLCEIGVYHGKYLALLARSGARTGDPVVGIDTFEYISLNAFLSYFGDKFDSETLAYIAKLNLKTIQASSGDFTERKLLSVLGTEPRFISIDGSHEYDDVYWDLTISERVLSGEGIISADDYLNPISLGVTAAVDHFLRVTPGLVPFAYVSNKLFLCRPSWADRYRTALESAILADASAPKTIEYRRHYDAGAGSRRNIEATYLGYRILTVRL